MAKPTVTTITGQSNNNAFQNNKANDELAEGIALQFPKDGSEPFLGDVDHNDFELLNVKGITIIGDNTTGNVLAGNINAIYRVSDIAPTDVSLGLLWYDTSTDPATLKVWNGDEWQVAVDIALGSFQREYFTATDGQTMFTFTYTVDKLDVYVNGSKLFNTEFTATDGTSVTLGSPLESGDEVTFISVTGDSVILADLINEVEIAAAEAEASALSASNSANEASVYATNSNDSATNAGVSETNALASENKAEQWAEEAEDVEVEAGKYSAYHWAQKAEESAGASNLDSLTDVTITTATSGQYLVYSGSVWENITVSPLTSSDIGVSVQAYDVDTAKTDLVQTFTASQRGTITTDNDLSFDLAVTNNFKCTPAVAGTLTFTNLTSGQSGNVLLDNTGGYAISAAASIKKGATMLTDISTAGVYWLSYYTDGTSVYVTYSEALS